LKNAWWQARDIFVRSSDLLLYILRSLGHSYVIGIHIHSNMVILTFVKINRRLCLYKDYVLNAIYCMLEARPSRVRGGGQTPSTGPDSCVKTKS